MVSGQTVGVVAVGLGTVMIVFDFTQAGLGMMVLGIAAAIVLGATQAGDDAGRKR